MVMLYVLVNCAGAARHELSRKRVRAGRKLLSLDKPLPGLLSDLKISGE